MKERPILFSAPMVRAILAGTKTQTRRIAQPKRSIEPMTDECPYGQPGDRLWVREAWRTTSAWDLTPPSDLPGRVDLHYEADGRPNAHFCFGKLRPGMFMPRAASRIPLEVTGVRVERLQDISEADAWAEGAEFEGFSTEEDWRRFGVTECLDARFRHAYRILWESINGPGSWDANPWVWVIEFQRIPPAAHA